MSFNLTVAGTLVSKTSTGGRVLVKFEDGTVSMVWKCYSDSKGTIRPDARFSPGDIIALGRAIEAALVGWRDD